MVEVNTTVRRKIDGRFIKKVSERFLKKYKKTKFSVSIAVVGEARMRRLNLIYRGIDKPTDVLSFSDGGQGRMPGEALPLGEIVLCLDAIRRQAREQGHPVKQELAFILVHGLLHLVGRDDKTEKGRSAMIKEGERFCANYKI